MDLKDLFAYKKSILVISSVDKHFFRLVNICNIFFFNFDKNLLVSTFNFFL